MDPHWMYPCHGRWNAFIVCFFVTRGHPSALQYCLTFIEGARLITGKNNRAGQRKKEETGRAGGAATGQRKRDGISRRNAGVSRIVSRV